jgi:menaquinone-dependent protoporphyrinogen IX oxidase
MMRVLVTYASKHGSTAQVAERIVQTLLGPESKLTSYRCGKSVT